MRIQEVDNVFSEAHRNALREYSRQVSRGQSGYLPSLEGLIKNVEITSEMDLGVVDIPLQKVAGTHSHSRALSFAANFMPLLKKNTEFGQKWMELCNAHMTEGIRDPIKVYEYMNWFYVVEGNKRVSVLKYFDAYSIPGKVSRLIPARNEQDQDVCIYYEFLEFYKYTKINAIWFSNKGSFKRLYKYIQHWEPTGLIYDSKFRYFTYGVYLPFRKLYHEIGGTKLPITTGDAFLEYIKLFGIPDKTPYDALKTRISMLLPELEHLSVSEKAEIHISPEDEKTGGFANALATLVIPKKKPHIAFAYAKSPETSAWTYSHEMGRRHVEKVLKDQVETSAFCDIPEDGEAYDYLKKLAKDGYNIIFATSPAFINACLKAALDFPEVKFYNCSETHSYKRVNTYFGRIYEARYLAGMVAGIMTKTNVVGYIGTFPVPEVVSGINAFALGAAMVNPRVRVRVSWTNSWDSHEESNKAGLALIDEGADIISHHDAMSGKDIAPEYGVYSMICDVKTKECEPGDYLAAPVWNWGIFYEQIIRNIINDTLKPLSDFLGGGSKLINFWWGMDSGTVDFFYSKRLIPLQSQKLVETFKRLISTNQFHPFTGPIYDKHGVLRVKHDQIADRDTIIGMEWFVDVIDNEMPVIDFTNIYDRDA